MTSGTQGYGFLRNSLRFQRKIQYWHFLPACTEIGFWCDGKSVPASMESFEEGLQIFDQFIFVATAAQAAKGRSPVNA